MDMTTTMTNTTSMSGMAMYFTSSSNTPLFSAAWTPTTTAGYAGTCVFLIILAFLSRCLLTWRHSLEAVWTRRTAAASRYVVVADERERFREKAKEGEGEEEEKMGGEKVLLETRAKSRNGGRGGSPWRLSVDLPRACVFTVQAGVGYLL